MNLIKIKCWKFSKYYNKDSSETPVLMLHLWREKEDIHHHCEDFVHPSITCSQYCYSDFYFTLTDHPYGFHIGILNAFHLMKSTAHSASLWVVVELTLLWKYYGNSCQLPLTPFCEWPSALLPHFVRKRRPPAVLPGLSLLSRPPPL